MVRNLHGGGYKKRTASSRTMGKGKSLGFILRTSGNYLMVFIFKNDII